MKKKSIIKSKSLPKIKKSDKLYRKIDSMSERDIALDFATKVHEKFDRIIKASILFGSQAKNTATAQSDVDVVLIIDDASINWDLELTAWYREELGRLIQNLDYGRELHVNTIKLTTWWQDLLYGEPVVINMLRYGEALIDSGGFFLPLKALLIQGKIRSTHEAVYAALQRSPLHLFRSKSAELSSIEGVYWCMVDAAQAALMTAGKLPPSPEQIPQMLHETFVENKMLKENYVRNFSTLHELHKNISHGHIASIKGSNIEQWQENAEAFLQEMTRIIKQLLENTNKE